MPDPETAPVLTLAEQVAKMQVAAMQQTEQAHAQLHFHRGAAAAFSDVLAMLTPATTETP